MSTPQQLPTPTAPIADPTGKITRPWLAALNAIWQKANGGTVTGSGTVGRLAKWLTATSLTDALAAASSKLLGSGATGIGSPYSEITLGTNLSMSGTTLNAAAAGGTVTTTGSPSSGNLTKFSGAASITNGNLSGDITTTNTLATTLANSGVTAATYGDATHVAQVTFDAKGRATSAANVVIAASGTVTHTAGNLTLNELVVGNAAADLKTVAATDGQVPIGKSSDGSVTLATLTAGANISITNAAAGITIAATTGGVGGSSLVLLEQYTAAVSTALNFTTAITSTYDDYLIEIVNLVTSAADRPQFQCSTDGGATYDTGANYDSEGYYSQFAGGGGDNGNTSVAGMQFRQANMTLGTNGSWNGSIRFMNPGGALLKVLFGHLQYFLTGQLSIAMWTGLYHNTTAVNAFRLNMVGGGTLTSGTVRVYGIAR